MTRRLYGWLLRLLPRAFRVRHAAELTDHFVALHREARRLGWRHQARLWCGAAGDLVVQALALRRRDLASGADRPARANRFARGFVADVRYAVRGFRRAPGFTAVALVTLALGIGGNTAVFSVLDAVLIEPLPYPAADRLVSVDFERPLTLEEFVALERLSAFERAGGSAGAILTVAGDGPAEEVAGAVVIGDLFDVLGATPALGRLLTPDDGRPGAPAVAVISHRYWRQRFGGDPGIVGRSLEIGGMGAGRRTVVGVVSQNFVPVEAGRDVWVPVVVDPADEEAYAHNAYLDVIGRLGRDVTIGQARAQVRALAARRAEASGEATREDAAAAVAVVELQRYLARQSAMTGLLLAGAVGLVLLMALVNVTSLWLARITSRARELEMRRALGASRGRLARQLLTESAVLSVAGAGLGVFVARAGTAMLGARLTAAVPGAEARLDGRVLLFTLGLALAVGLLAGLGPALRAARLDAPAPAAGRGQTIGRRDARANRRLVSVEVALAVVLVAGAGLFIRSLDRARRMEPGFDAARTLSLRLRPPASRYPDAPRQEAYYRRVIESVSTLRDVEAAGAIHLLPLGGGGMGVGYRIDGEEPRDGVLSVASYRIVEPGYFASMGIPLRRGRGLADTDRAGTPTVAVVNETLARAIARQGEALGRRFTDEDGATWMTVVGVVGDIRQSTLEQPPRPEVYVPAAQALEFLGSMFLTVRTTGDPAAAAPSVVAAVRRVDDRVPVSLVRPMRRVMAASLSERRFVTGLFALFAALALALGAAGVYGVLSQAVGARTREIGIRMAVGASRGAVGRWAVGEGLRPVAWGVGAGVLAAAALHPLVASHLVDAAAADPAVLAGVAALLVAVAAAASWAPARRAARIDPIEVLKTD